MAAQSFRDVVLGVQLQAPGAPPALLQKFCQDAYDELIGKRHWGWSRRTIVLTTLAQRTIAITFTQGSTAITSAALFVASDAGRQVRFGTDFIYTISVVTDASNAILVETYGEVSGAKNATIHDRYLAMPADFRSFLSVSDMSTQRPVPWWISRERLDLFDPGRISSDSRFRVLAANQLSQAAALLGRVLYEAWPQPTAAGGYTVMYFIRTDRLVDDANLTGVLATYTKAIEQGALANLALWPGTPDQKNPYFNMGLADRLKREHEEAVKSLDLEDDDQYLQDLQQVDLSSFGLASLSASTTYLRSSDATLGDYI